MKMYIEIEVLEFEPSFQEMKAGLYWIPKLGKLELQQYDFGTPEAIYTSLSTITPRLHDIPATFSEPAVIPNAIQVPLISIDDAARLIFAARCTPENAHLALKAAESK